MTSSNRKLSVSEKLFLSAGVPLIILGLLEIACRIFHTDALFAKKSDKIELEMPTWMQDDDNQSARATAGTFDKSMVDWLNIFEEGNGFRVRLVPGVEKSVTNTFSLISADKTQKYLVKANSLGFRGPEISQKKSQGVYRILVFGDSSSFGWGVNQNETYSALLPALLKERTGKEFEVGNFAIPGDSTEYGRLIFEKYEPLYESDMVILGFGANDAKKAYYPHESQVERFRSYYTMQRVKSIAKVSALFRTLESIVNRSAPEVELKDLPKKVPAVPRRRFAENLKAMGEAALEKGSKTLLVSLCTPENYAFRAEKLAEERDYLYLNGQGYLRDRIPDISNGSVYPQDVDAMRASYGSSLNTNSLFYVTSDACHPNKLGHRLIAEKLADLIAPTISNQPSKP